MGRNPGILQEFLSGPDIIGVEENRDLYGENVTKGQEDSIFKKIYESTTPHSIATALVSLVTSMFHNKPGEEDPTTSIIVVLVPISGSIRFIQETVSDRAANLAYDCQYSYGHSRRTEQELPIDELVVGDIIV